MRRDMSKQGKLFSPYINGEEKGTGPDSFVYVFSNENSNQDIPFCRSGVWNSGSKTTSHHSRKGLQSVLHPSRLDSPVMPQSHARFGGGQMWMFILPAIANSQPFMGNCSFSERCVSCSLSLVVVTLIHCSSLSFISMTDDLLLFERDYLTEGKNT